jgi:peptidoglycan/xylan/chitin deacetylase (PgdA/CDA1 family)
MKSVMYHYVREGDIKHPNFRYLHVAYFRRQLDYFERNFGFVTREEWSAFVKRGRMPDKSGKAVLTFDDAMACHYTYVFPELMKRGLWGIFYVPTRPYREKLVLDVHRIHLLCGARNGNDLLNAALSLVSEDMIPDSKISEFRTNTYRTQHNAAGVSAFKRLLNYFIDYSYRPAVLDRIAQQFDYRFDLESFYIPLVALAQMKREGMVIGSHTDSHPVMSKLDRSNQKSEIELSRSVLTGIIGQDVKAYSHPYGGFHSFNTDTVDLLNRAGMNYAFNVEPREIVSRDWHASRHFLPRFDCNMFEYGKAS